MLCYFEFVVKFLMLFFSNSNGCDDGNDNDDDNSFVNYDGNDNENNVNSNIGFDFNNGGIFI